MKNARKLFESEMQELLQYVIVNRDIPEENKLNMEVLKECCDKGYISGVQTMTMINGRIVAEVCETCTVTKEGLDFLHPKIDVKFIVSTSIATISVLINILLLLREFFPSTP
jgi:hypothetical protein